MRRLRCTGAEIAELLGMPLATTSAVLRRLGMGRLVRLGREPAVRYERERPGELIHIDVKKLGRIQGRAGKRVTGRTGNNGSRTRVDAAVERAMDRDEGLLAVLGSRLLEDQKKVGETAEAIRLRQSG